MKKTQEKSYVFRLTQYNNFTFTSQNYSPQMQLLSFCIQDGWLLLFVVKIDQSQLLNSQPVRYISGNSFPLQDEN